MSSTNNDDFNTRIANLRLRIAQARAKLEPPVAEEPPPIEEPLQGADALRALLKGRK